MSFWAKFAVLTVVGGLSLLAIRPAYAPTPSQLRPDSSAAVVVLKNPSTDGLTVFAKVPGGAFSPLGLCPAASLCLFVLPSAELGDARGLTAVVLGGPDSLRLEQRAIRNPGVVNLLLLVAAPRPPETPPATKGFSNVR